MQKLINILREGGYSCVIEQGERISVFSQRGVADLYDIYRDEPLLLKDACMADKVVGKGAAALMVSGGIRSLYAGVISEPALKLLTDAGIEVRYDTLTPHIINRAGTDRCPLEKSCDGMDQAEQILPVITQFIAKIRSQVRV